MADESHRPGREDDAPVAAEGMRTPTDARSTESAAPPVESSARVGLYRILHKIGEGSMGEVWEAEQLEPVRRRVALKVIKHGMDSARVLARFEAERQALALMDHPAIATIYDAGTMPDGRPYFAMEYVPGVPITEHCDRQKLTNVERLELFLQVCEGVQHAHHKAVIHRDLKPSNVLVEIRDGRPAAKIIDFGVAKAISQRLTERTLSTELGVMIGTPEYMSPEQAEITGQDVDTRSDVYSLGVMLYELLVGALPFEPRELRQAGFDEIRRKIREDEPPRPSARLATLGDRSTESARRRQTDPGALRRELVGDLDWITMRALEKNPARRYGSPSELADDIRRHLRFEPVLAHAPSVAYRASRFVRRHRLGVAAAAVMAAGLLAGTVGSTVGLVRARRAEARAVREAQVKGQVADFLKNLFKVSNPSQMRGNSVTARELLDQAAARIDTELPDQPELRAELMAIMGDAYDNLGLFAAAETLSAEALETLRRALGPEHPDTLNAMGNLAGVYWNQGRYDEAERLYAAALAVQRRVLGPEHPDTLSSTSNLAGVYWNQGRYDESARLQSEALEIRKRVLGPEHPDTLTSMDSLAAACWSQARLPAAQRLYSEALAIRRRVLGPEHPDTLGIMGNLGAVYWKEGRLVEAERLYSDALAIQKRTLGPEHPDTLMTVSNLANIYDTAGRHAEAERLLSETLAIQKRVLGPEHPSTLVAMNNLAHLYQGLRRHDDAERLHSETLAIRRRVLGPEHPDTLLSMNNLACAQRDRGRYAEAERLFAETLAIRKRVLGPEHPDTLLSMANLASGYRLQGRYPAAERLYSETFALRRRVLGPGHPDTLATMYALARVAALAGDRAKGMDWLRQTVEAGYADADKLAGEADLKTLHGPEFDTLLGRVRRNAAAR